MIIFVTLIWWFIVIKQIKSQQLYRCYCHRPSWGGRYESNDFPWFSAAGWVSVTCSSWLEQCAWGEWKIICVCMYRVCCICVCVIKRIWDASAHISNPACALLSLWEGEADQLPVWKRNHLFLICHKMDLSTKRDFFFLLHLHFVLLLCVKLISFGPCQKLFFLMDSLFTIRRCS